ncbi:MAG: truncated hemoglobin [Microcella sp.]
MSLYDDIGGAAAVTVAVTVFYTRVTDDPELAPWFGGVDIERLKAHQRAFLTAALGGPDLFTGRTMEAAHAGLGITIEAFERVLEHLAYTLFDLGLGYDQVTAIVDGLRPIADVVVESSTAPR